jgi:predicted small metal-binding protein
MKNILKKFRCPFHTKGDKENTIVDVHTDGLTETHRIAAIREGYKKFFEQDLTALRMHLPSHLTKACRSNIDLRLHLLRYQVEILAIELDERLHPFLSYQNPFGSKNHANADDMIRHKIAQLLEIYMGKNMHQATSFASLKESLYKFFEKKILSGSYRPQFMLTSDGIDLAVVQLEGFISMVDKMLNYEMMAKNSKDTFNIVTTPFYPESTPRFSKDVCIIMTKQRDFNKVSLKEREKIRKSANQAYRDAGINISLSEMLPGGLWIPEIEHSKIQ